MNIDLFQYSLWLSKIYERLICKQLINFINVNHIYKETMSGFRKNHFTEMLLLKIKDDVMKAHESK